MATAASTINISEQGEEGVCFGSALRLLCEIGRKICTSNLNALHVADRFPVRVRTCPLTTKE